MLEIVKSGYMILYQLYPDKDLFLAQLADMAKVDDGNLSRDILKLEEAGLVSTREVSGERGKPKKYIRLTDKGIGCLSPYIRASQVTAEPLNTADSEDIELYLKMMAQAENKEAQLMASEEFVTLCREYVVTKDDRVLSFISNKIQAPEYRDILINLLDALRSIFQNTKEEETREKIRLTFVKPLKELVLNSSMKTSNAERTICYTSLNTLTALSEGEEGYTNLIQILQTLIEAGSPISHNARQLILSRYPEKKNEIRRTLLKMLTNPNENVRRLTENHIRELRTVDRTWKGEEQSRPYDSVNKDKASNYS